MARLADGTALQVVVRILLTAGMEYAYQGDAVFVQLVFFLDDIFGEVYALRLGDEVIANAADAHRLLRRGVGIGKSFLRQIVLNERLGMAFCRITLELGIDFSRLSLYVGVALLHVALPLLVLIPGEKLILM